MRKTAMALSTLVIMFILCAIALEGAYRVYLNFRLASVVDANEQIVAQKMEEAESKTFKVYGSPGPWLYAEDYGFDFSEGPWLQAQFVNGKLSRCSSPNGGNRFGNIGVRNPNYEGADFKVHIYGSSYSMGTLEGGEALAEGLEQALSGDLGVSVTVLNFSRDSIGLLTNFDAASVKVPELKPDMVLFLANYSAFFFGRHWRHLEPVDDEIGRLVFTFKSASELGPDDERVGAVRLVSKLVDQVWCGRVSDTPTEADNADIDRMAVINRDLVWEARKQPLPIDFFSLSRSFILNRVLSGNAFQGVEIFTDSEKMKSIEVRDFEDDEKTIQAIRMLEDKGTPYVFLNIPTLQGMLTPPKGRFHFGLQKTDDAIGRALVKSLERLAGRKFEHLYDWFPDEVKANPLSIVTSEQDSHPNAMGNRVLVDAIVDALKDTPSTKHLFE